MHTKRAKMKETIEWVIRKRDNISADVTVKKTHTQKHIYGKKNYQFRKMFTIICL